MRRGRIMEDKEERESGRKKYTKSGEKQWEIHRERKRVGERVVARLT